MSTTSKRIPGIGTLRGASLTLTCDATKRAGHLLAEGADGGDAARKVRREIEAVAQTQADAIGRPVEVYASARGKQGWVVDVVEPRSAA